MSPNCRILPRKNYMESSLLRYVHASNDTIRKKGKFVRGTKSQSSASIYILLTQFGALVFLLCKDKEYQYFRRALKIYHYDITYGIWSVSTKNAMFFFPDFENLMTALGLVQTAKAMEDNMDSHDGHDHRRRKRAVPDALTGNESFVRISLDTFVYTCIYLV